MDRTTRLIKWQRLTIAALLLGLILAGVSAASYRRSLHATEVLFLSDMREDIAVADRVIAELDRRNNVQKNVQRTIHDLNERLRRYEAKFGKIDPRRGEGEYTASQGLKPQLDR
jgi:hypothetical protein